MMNLINGFHVARVLYVAAKLYIADLVKDGPLRAPISPRKPAWTGLRSIA